MKFYRRLREYYNRKKKKRIFLDQLEDIYKRTHPERYFPSPDWQFLLELLEKYEREGKLKLPRGDQYVIMSGTHLPKWITLSVKKTENFTEWKSHKWHPKMVPVLSLDRMSEKRFKELLMVEDFIKHSGNELATALTIKERSIQVLGDEKRLDALATQLRAVLNLPELLNCFETHEPIVHRTFDTESKRCIVIENRDTFYSMCRANEEIPVYRTICYGMGKVFIRSVRSLEEITEITTIEYFGDIDHSGLNIPHQAAKEASLEIELNGILYAELIGKHRALGRYFPDKRVKLADSSLLQGLPDKDYVVELLGNGERIPQEVLNYTDLRDIFRSKRFQEYGKS